MRTTLTLDPDVAAMIRSTQLHEQKSLRDVVNEALRTALSNPGTKAKGKKKYRTITKPLGRSVFNNLDNIEEVLDLLEGVLRK